MFFSFDAKTTKITSKVASSSSIELNFCSKMNVDAFFRMFLNAEKIHGNILILIDVECIVYS